MARGPHKGTQTEESHFGSSCTTNGTNSVHADGVLPECSCDAKKVFNDLKDDLKREHNEEKDSALKSLEERVRTCVVAVFCLLPHAVNCVRFCF